MSELTLIALGIASVINGCTILMAILEIAK